MHRHTVTNATPQLREAGLLSYSGEAERGTEMTWIMPGQVPPIADRSILAMLEPDRKKNAKSEEPQVTAPEEPTKITPKPEPKVAERKKRGKTKPAGAKKAALTEEQKAAMLTNTPEALVMMERYLQYGAAGLNAPTTDGLPSASTDWRQLQEGEDPKIGEWTIPMFAGYFWYLASWYKVTRCDPPRSLTLPKFGRLIGDTKVLLGTRTKHQAHQYLQDVIRHWALICYLGGRAGMSLELSSDTLSNPIVASGIAAIQGRGQEWIDAQYAALRASIEMHQAG